MLFCKVAGILFGVGGSAESQPVRLPSNYAPFAVRPDCLESPVFTFISGPAPGLPAGPPEKIFRYDIAEDSGMLRIWPDRYVLSVRCAAGQREFVLDCPLKNGRDGSQVQVFYSGIALDGSAPRHITDHFLLFSFSLACLRHKALVIHSSAVIYEGRSVIFLGESGTGKSTHARLWTENIPGVRLLNDDGPVVSVDESGVTVHGSPWSGKTPCYINESHPLEAVVRLRQAPRNKIANMDKLGSFGALLPSCLPVLQQDEGALDGVCGALSEIIASVPVHTLDCLPDAAAARLSFAACFPGRPLSR